MVKIAKKKALIIDLFIGRYKILYFTELRIILKNIYSDLRERKNQQNKLESFLESNISEET